MNLNRNASNLPCQGAPVPFVWKCEDGEPLIIYIETLCLFCKAEGSFSLDVYQSVEMLYRLEKFTYFKLLSNSSLNRHISTIIYSKENGLLEIKWLWVLQKMLCAFWTQEIHLLSFKKKVLFLFMITAGDAINFYFAVQIFFIGKDAKTVIITPLHSLLGI